MFSLAKTDGKICLKGKNDIGFFKVVISKDERSLIDDLLDSLEKLFKTNNHKPNIFTFYSNYYISNIVMRSIKFGNFKNATPMKKYAIIDLKASLGNYNSLFDCFEYLGLSELQEKIFYTSELEEDARTKNKPLFHEFFEYSSNKILSLAKLTKFYLDSTYGNDFRQNIVLDIETHADLTKREKFLMKFPKYKESTDEEILELMSRNPLYNIFYSYSLCVLN